MTPTRSLVLGLIALAVLVFVALRPPSAPAYTYPPITVDTVDGPVALADLRGKVVLVSFGYTACPDICPNTMLKFVQAKQALPAALYDDVTSLMVSVDPARDSPERLAGYVRHFDPDFVAGVIPEPELRAIANGWGIVYRSTEDPGSALPYAVDHTTDLFVVDRSGTVQHRLPHGTSPPDLARVLREVLADE